MCWPKSKCKEVKFVGPSAPSAPHSQFFCIHDMVASIELSEHADVWFNPNNP